MQSHSTREINKDQEIRPVRWAARSNVQISDLRARAVFARVSHQLFLSRYVLSRHITRCNLSKSSRGNKIKRRSYSRTT